MTRRERIGTGYLKVMYKQKFKYHTNEGTARVCLFFLCFCFIVVVLFLSERE